MSVQPIQRRSTRLAAMKQIAPSFADLPELALSAIHDILMHWREDSQQFIECALAQHAAAFRSTCKAFNVAAMWPRTLKLHFHKPLSVQATQSLAAMLSRPAAANTQLYLRLDRKASCYDQAWVHRLAGLRVMKLQMPCHSINATLEAACTAVPRLQSVHLYINSATEVGVPPLKPPPLNSGSQVGRAAVNGSWLSRSKLRKVTLIVPPGDPPFHLRGSSSSPLLDLSGFPAFKQLRLLGPIVKDSLFFKHDEVPLVLPASAKVVVGTNLGNREPTPWARGPAASWMAQDLPGNALPSSHEYDEEDSAARERRLCAFAQRVADIACEIAEERGLEGAYGLRRNVMDRLLSFELLEDLMADVGCLWRSDLLDSRLGAFTVAEDEVDVYEEEGDSEMYGYGYDGCCCGGGGF